MYEPHNVHGRLVYAMTVKKNGNSHGTFTTKVVRSVFILLATRGHDILYSVWREKILHIYIALTLSCTVHNSARVIFLPYIIVVLIIVNKFSCV